MDSAQDAPLSGVFRVVYFLAIATVSVFLVVSGVRAFYDPPDEPSGFPGDGFFEPGDSFDDGPLQDEANDDREDYNRNVSLIVIAISGGVFALAILGLGSRFNPLRAGLLLGGLIIYLVGMGFWADSTNEWIGFLMTFVVFAVLAGSYAWLEDGLPLGHSGGRRIVIVDPATPATPSPSPPPEPPPDA